MDRGLAAQRQLLDLAAGSASGASSVRARPQRLLGALDPRAIALLERAPGGRRCLPGRPPSRRPRRAPARSAFGPASAARPRCPGFDGRGRDRPLDTGVDLGHPYLGAACCPVDVVAATRRERAPQPARRTEIEQHGTELAGIIVGSGGPAAFSARARARVLPIRVAGWQPTARQPSSSTRRTDQLMAGLERAVDPNGDGDAHDAVRLAVVGVAEPYAAFADGPEARAGRARRPGTLVVAPPGTTAAPAPCSARSPGPAGVRARSPSARPTRGPQCRACVSSCAGAST